MLFSYISSFSPAVIPNLSLWLDASDTTTITQVAGLVSQWADKSGNGNNAVQATGARQPTTGATTLNGLNVIDFIFDGGTDFMSVPALLSLPSANYTAFVVHKPSGFGSFNRLIGDASQFSVVAENSANRWAVYNNSTFANPAVLSGRTTDPQITEWMKNGTVLSASRNGVAGTNGVAGNQSTTSFNISSGSDPYTGSYGEIVMFARALTTAEINQIGNYLSAKWGISWSNL